VFTSVWLFWSFKNLTVYKRSVAVKKYGSMYFVMLCNQRAGLYGGDFIIWCVGLRAWSALWAALPAHRWPSNEPIKSGETNGRAKLFAFDSWQLECIESGRNSVDDGI
jgi:hypothetical protein